ncbi:hypothetical protein [Pararhodobacter sp.]|uniref:hypothetical protein n=1 Tax=Pararhodobacter sp. TaxID=2127056 RepID=UPI001E0275C7|nr:hypothetical protein [Pararhodobacter sp.]MCB1344992.1 hypothetical protein [Paracoccaceae bacterium]
MAKNRNTRSKGVDLNGHLGPALRAKDDGPAGDLGCQAESVAVKRVGPIDDLFGGKVGLQGQSDGDGVGDARALDTLGPSEGGKGGAGTGGIGRRLKTGGKTNARVAARIGPRRTNGKGQRQQQRKNAERTGATRPTPHRAVLPMQR